MVLTQQLLPNSAPHRPQAVGTPRDPPPTLSLPRQSAVQCHSSLPSRGVRPSGLRLRPAAPGAPRSRSGLPSEGAWGRSALFTVCR